MAFTLSLGWLGLVEQSVLTELLAERATIQTQHRRRMALIVLGIVEHCLEQGRFYLMQDHVIQVAAALSVEGREKMGDGLCCAVSQRRRPRGLRAAFLAGGLGLAEVMPPVTFRL